MHEFSDKVIAQDYLNADVRRVTKVSITMEAESHLTHNDILTIIADKQLRGFHGLRSGNVTVMITSTTVTKTRQTL